VCEIGSEERSKLEAALKQVKSEVVEIPCVVNGKAHYTGIVELVLLVLQYYAFL
jgi:hypothetical protein